MTSKTAKITTELVESLRPGETVMDRDLSGFMVRRQRSKACVYAVRKYANGKRHFETIGEHGRNGWTEARARKQAVIVIGALHKGDDPAAARAKVKGVPTLAEWAKGYIDVRASKLKPATLASYRSVLGKHIAPRDEAGKLQRGCLGGRRLDDITRLDVEAFHTGLENTKRTANLAVVFLSALFSKAQLVGLLTDGKRHNPAHQIEKYYERQRERFLTAEELGRLGEAIAAAHLRENAYALAALRLLILTGARRGEILSMRWADVDFERARIMLSDHKTLTTGAGGTKAIYLNAAAVEVLTGLARVEGNPYAIVGDREGSHLVNLRATWLRIRDAAGLEPAVLPNGKIEPVRIHDLRHSFASSLTSNQGANLMLIGKLLGHSNPKTTQRYAHLLPDLVEHHCKLAGERITAAMSGKAKPRDASSAAQPEAADLFSKLLEALNRLPAKEQHQLAARVSRSVVEERGAEHLATALEGLAQAVRRQFTIEAPTASAQVAA